MSHVNYANDLESALSILSQKIAITQDYYKFFNYAELAYLQRVFKPPYIDSSHQSYFNKTNDYYYKNVMLYNKLFDNNARVYEDCFTDEGTNKLPESRKMLVYCLNPELTNEATLVDRLEEYSTEEVFFGPYTILMNIYFLKEFSYHKLTEKSKSKLAVLEKRLCTNLYNNYFNNKPISFYKLMTCKVLKMNKFNFDDSGLIKEIKYYFNTLATKNTNIYDLPPSDADAKDVDLMKRVGMKDILQFETIACLWIFLLENEKK